MAISYFHNLGVFHRDLKPENIMITDNFEIKIIDFSSCTDQLKSLPEGGTPSYCPFEWHYEKECLNPAIDVFSLGVILYNMFTKSVFFNGISNEGFKKLEKSE